MSCPFTRFSKQRDIIASVIDVVSFCEYKLKEI